MVSINREPFFQSELEPVATGNPVATSPSLWQVHAHEGDNVEDLTTVCAKVPWKPNEDTPTFSVAEGSVCNGSDSACAPDVSITGFSCRNIAFPFVASESSHAIP